MSVSPSYEILPPSDVRGKHIRAARALLGWTKIEAARACGVGVNTMGRFEEDSESLTPRTVQDIVRRFEDEGIVFLQCRQGAGVVLRQSENDDG